MFDKAFEFGRGLAEEFAEVINERDSLVVPEAVYNLEVSAHGVPLPQGEPEATPADVAEVVEMPQQTDPDHLQITEIYGQIDEAYRHAA